MRISRPGLQALKPRLIAVVCAVVTFVAILPALAAPPLSESDRRALEEYLAARINQGRETPSENAFGGQTYGLAFHEGLRAKARENNDTGIALDEPGHYNTAARVATASPDPASAETTPGAPDDGFGVWCEIAARSSWIPGGISFQGQAMVDAFYDAFRGSQTHRGCMFDEAQAGYTVGPASRAKSARTATTASGLRP